MGLNQSKILIYCTKLFLLKVSRHFHHPIPSVPFYQISLLSLFTKEGRQYPKELLDTVKQVIPILNQSSP